MEAECFVCWLIDQIAFDWWNAIWWASDATVSCRAVTEMIHVQQQDLQAELEACIDHGAVHYLKDWFCAAECLKQLTASVCWTITSFFFVSSSIAIVTFRIVSLFWCQDK